MRPITRLLFVIAAFLAMASAQVPEVNATSGVAIKGYDAVAFFRLGVAAMGREDFNARHHGVTYLFINASHRDAFLASPNQFLPQYGGYCAYGAARGYKADIDPNAFSLVGGKLYLNYNEQVKRDWQKDVPGNVRRADERWHEVRVMTKVHK